MTEVVMSVAALPDHEDVNLRSEAIRAHHSRLEDVRNAIGNEPAHNVVNVLGISHEDREVAVRVLMKLLGSAPDFEESDVLNPPATAGQLRIITERDDAMREFVGRLATSWSHKDRVNHG